MHDVTKFIARAPSKIKSHHSNFVRCSFACFVDALCFTQSSNTNSHHTDKLYSEIVWAEIQAKVRGRALIQFCCHRSVGISAVILEVFWFSALKWIEKFDSMSADKSLSKRSGQRKRHAVMISGSPFSFFEMLDNGCENDIALPHMKKLRRFWLSKTLVLTKKAIFRYEDFKHSNVTIIASNTSRSCMYFSPLIPAPESLIF